MSEVINKAETSDLSRDGRSANARHEERKGMSAPLRPAGDIFEHDDGITVVLDMPGVSKDRLQIQADRSSLVIEGDIEFAMPNETESLYADVRSTRYRRTFSLSGEQLDTDAVAAVLNNGVLRVDIPKRAEMRPRRITVQVA